MYSLQVQKITLNVKCYMRDQLTIEIDTASTTRDIYLQVSAKTSISRTLFQLFFCGDKLPDTIVEIDNYNIKHGAMVLLHPHVQSGLFGANFVQLSPARQAVRKYAYGLNPDSVESFFRAETTLRIRIPVAHIYGILKFKLDTPLSDDPQFYIANFERRADLGETQIVHSMTNPADLTYSGKFNGDLAPDLFNSRRTPGRTVDTITCMLDNLLKTCGF